MHSSKVGIARGGHRIGKQGVWGDRGGYGIEWGCSTAPSPFWLLFPPLVSRDGEIGLQALPPAPLSSA